MNITSQRMLALAAMLLANLIFAARSQADPLSGEVPKFDQQPLVQTAIAGALYFGHDELSTAYGVGTAASPPLNYQGRFMADDFADKVSTPVFHLSWWGSYINDTAPTPQAHVQKFLVAFESDVPATPGNFSHPGTVLDYDIVTLGGLTPGSGTFTESLVRGPDTVSNEAALQVQRRTASRTRVPRAGEYRLLAEGHRLGRYTAATHHPPAARHDAMGLARPRLHDSRYSRFHRAGRGPRRKPCWKSLWAEYLSLPGRLCSRRFAFHAQRPSGTRRHPARHDAPELRVH